MAASVAASWQLSKTVTDGLIVSRGVMEAATSDNVQPIAILACEAFGATLPMSSESCAKAHLHCSQTHESAVLAFLKVKIGFRKGDCGWQLAHSDAGLRFLALSACLLSMDWWSASEALRQLIIESAEDRKLVPTSHQLKQLLSALDYRLACLGFSDSVVGWSTWLARSSKIDIQNHSTLSQTTLVKLIQSMSKLARLGQTHSLHIETRIHEAAWIIAFTKWCLGAPPTIVLPYGEPGLFQEGARVFLYPTAEGNAETIITAKDKLETIIELISDLPPGPGYLAGMVSVPTFAAKSMECFGEEGDLRFRASRDAIFYGCQIVLRKFRIRSELEAHKSEPGWTHNNTSLGCYFADDNTMDSTLVEFIGSDTVKSIRQSPTYTWLDDVPSVSTAKDILAAGCGCGICRLEGGQEFPWIPEVPRESTLADRCRLRLFEKNVCLRVAAIIAISLFVSATPQGFHLEYRHCSCMTLDYRRNDENLVSKVIECLSFRARTLYVTPEEILSEALNFTDQDQDPKIMSKWVMSSQRGQTVFPEILTHLTLRNSGYMRLLCVPGVILYDGQPYNVATGPPVVYDVLEARFAGNIRSVCFQAGEVLASDSSNVTVNPQNRYPGQRVVWQVSPLENRLQVSLVISDVPGMQSRNPTGAVCGSARSWFVNCPHDPATPLNECQHKMVYPMSMGNLNPYQSVDKIGILHTDRNETMRFFALCSGRACIVREEACLACCIDVCQRVGLRVVIC